MTELNSVLAKHDISERCTNSEKQDRCFGIDCHDCEYYGVECSLDCPRCAQDRLIEKLKTQCPLLFPSNQLDENPDGTYADGFVDGKVAQLEHDMETINKILGET